MSVNPRKIVEYTTLALKTLETLLIDARYIFTRTGGSLSYKKRKRIEIGQEAVAFIRGTGLDLMLLRYELEIDADTIRKRLCETYGIKY